MNTNFENIKVGDVVIYTTGGWHSHTHISKVTKTTPKQFKAGAFHFRKSDGAMIGDTYIKCRYATEEDIRKHEERKYRLSLVNEVANFFHSSGVPPSSLSNTQLEEIIKIIKPTAQ